MKLKVLQKGFNFSQDGPGNRLVYHLQGCNFRCPWCSNPESISIGGTIMIPNDPPRESDCPAGAVRDGKLDRKICSECTEKGCGKIPGCRIKLTGTDYDNDEIFEEILSGRMMFFSGGGVTFTGGEPTLQYDSLLDLLKRCREAGINTAIETNASHPKICELSEHIDYLIADCKHYDCEKHKNYIGKSNKGVIENLRRLSAERNQLMIHIPLVGKFNSSEKDAEEFSNLFNSFNNKNLQLEVLRYHEYGKDKWAQCAMEYKMHDGFVSDEEYNKFINVLKKNGIAITNT